MRMSGLCKVEMSAFMDGRGPHGNGANHVEPTRTGPIESVARGQAAASFAASSSGAAENNGPPGAAHSNRKLAAPLEHKILARLRQRYADFGPTLAAERLAQEGFLVSRETLRKWMTQAALWRPRSQRVKAAHVWRERRASFGELVMQDSSPFRYDSIGGVTAITADSAHTYNFKYALDEASHTLNAFVTEPSGTVIHVKIHSQEGKPAYSIPEIARCTGPSADSV
jgi:hypothetical protein